MAKEALAAAYRDYIACLNRGDWQKLGRLVHKDVQRNPAKRNGPDDARSYLCPNGALIFRGIAVREEYLPLRASRLWRPWNDNF